MHLIDRLEVEEKARVSQLFSGKLVQQIEYRSTAAPAGSGEAKPPELAVSATEMPFCGPWTLEIPPQFRVGLFVSSGRAPQACPLHSPPTPPSRP